MNDLGQVALNLNPNLTRAERLRILSRDLDHEEEMYRRITANLADAREEMGPGAAAELADWYIRMCLSLREPKLYLYCAEAHHFFLAVARA